MLRGRYPNLVLLVSPIQIEEENDETSHTEMSSTDINHVLPNHHQSYSASTPFAMALSISIPAGVENVVQCSRP